MPCSVADVLAVAGLAPQRAVRWRAQASEGRTGIYVVALTDDPTSLAAALPDAPLARDQLQHLLDVRPELRLDGFRPSAAQLAERLAAFWLPDEVVLYVGLAGQPLRTRVRQYYGTRLGAAKPHAGGWWLKTLSILEELWVHCAATDHYETAERVVLTGFVHALSPASRAALHDPARPAPFANFRTGTGAIKNHGITGATGPLPQTSGGVAGTPSRRRRQTPSRQSSDFGVRAAPNTSDGSAASQRVTAKDLEAGRVRFPRAAKQLFPPERAGLDVVVRGVALRASWDPRVGSDRERSGVLAFGRGKLDGLLSVDEVLTITVAGGKPAALG